MSLSAARIGTEVRPGGAISLVHQLAQALDRERVVYCQWKGHWKRERWERGAGDLDLLVDQASLPRFARALSQLGFKSAVWPPQWQVPGIESYFGFDRASGRLVHVHTHYQLVIGSPWRTTYRLPIEHACLASVEHHGLFATPAPEYELLTFVLRLVQRFSLREPLRTEPAWVGKIQGELTYLVERANRAKLVAILARNLPSIDLAFLDRCMQLLAPGASSWQRVGLRRELHRRLAAYSRRPPLTALVSALTGRASGKRPQIGGLLVALNGGDGAGKTTCTRELAAWLAPHLGVRTAHLGRPPRSLMTWLVGGALKVASLMGADQHVELLRFVCTARDRHRLYVASWRWASHGGVSICERYPVPETWALAGPSTAQGLAMRVNTGLARLLRRWEARYYNRIARPDLHLVLLVHPELAVRRKPDEPASYVRARNTVMWETDWGKAGARVVDAERPIEEVLGELKSLIWSAL
ncbi:MAG: hypothetical protein HY560_14110 [Gemmatimonadetes bacterium]|nr:hypothetical protein [Gemmatimonadota bacterium]